MSGARIELPFPRHRLWRKKVRFLACALFAVSCFGSTLAATGKPLKVLGVFNGDFTFNSAANPAQAGWIMILYLAGAGQTNPPSQDGQINAAPFAAPGMPITLQWVDINPNNPTILPSTFAGAAPGLAAGIFQVNFVAPQQTLFNVNLLIGNSGTRFNVFVHP
jgi:uncharacterized protein (TIGR03437 family)